MLDRYPMNDHDLEAITAGKSRTSAPTPQRVPLLAPTVARTHADLHQPTARNDAREGGCPGGVCSA